MNNARRKSLRDAIGLIDQAQTLADQAAEIIQNIAEEEQEAFDGLPEPFQNGERGDAMQAAISALENVELEEIFAEPLSYIEEAMA